MGEAPVAPVRLRLVCFELRGQELAFSIAHVRETLPIQPITRVPLTPACLAGVFSLRGDIVPAVDLGILFGLTATDVTDDSRIIVIDVEGATIGVIADRLRDLRTIEDALEPPPASLAPNVAQLVAGILVTQTGSVRVLDAASIIAAEPLRVLARGAEEERTA